MRELCRQGRQGRARRGPGGASSCTSSLDWGAHAGEVGLEGAGACRGLPRADGRRPSRHHRRDRGRVAQRVVGLTGATLEHAPVRLPDLRLVAVAQRPDGGEGPLDREGRGRVGRLGRALPRRRRTPARLDPVRPFDALSPAPPSFRPAPVRRCGARDVRLRRLERDAVGRAVAVPRRDRGGARQGREGTRGVRVPLPRGRVDVRALPRPSHGLPARLPRRLRLPGRCGPRGGSSCSGSSSAGSCRCSKASGLTCSAWSRRRSRRRPCRSAPESHPKRSVGFPFASSRTQARSRSRHSFAFDPLSRSLLLPSQSQPWAELCPRAPRLSRRGSLTPSLRASGARRPWPSRRTDGCSSRRSSARSRIVQNGSLLPTPGARSRDDAVHGRRTRPARRGGRPVVRVERLRLPLLHAEQER